MNISLLYTSARPHVILNVLGAWQERASDWENIEVVLVTDDPFEGCFANMKSYVNSGRRDCVTGWNLAAAKATGEMFVQVSDDLLPPDNWDQTLMSLVGRTRFYSLQLPDERGLTECVFHPVISRAVYKHFGYLYPPVFKSMFCDNWLFYAHDHFGFLRRIEMERFWNHTHRLTHDVEADEVFLRHESPERYAEGREIIVTELAKFGIKILYPPEPEEAQQ